MMVNFMCQLGWALVPRYLVKHYSGMCQRRILRHKLVDLRVGLTQLVERPNRTKTDLPQARNSAIRLRLQRLLQPLSCCAALQTLDL